MSCLRCGRDFSDPVPSVTNPDGRNPEVACRDWCGDCNRIAMMAVHRTSSLYFFQGAVDPIRGKMSPEEVP